MTPRPTEQLHASVVAFEGRGVIIMGPSGSGKSALALQLMAHGCHLVSDDRVLVCATDGGLVAICPPSIRGRIEARGIGILAAAAAPSARLLLAVDMGATTTQRMPPARTIDIAGVPLPLVLRVDSAHFPAAILQYLKSGAGGLA